MAGSGNVEVGGGLLGKSVVTPAYISRVGCIRLPYIINRHNIMINAVQDNRRTEYP